MAKQLILSGSKEEQELFTEVNHHYDLAVRDLTDRLTAFDKVDKLFRSHIDKNKWPYRALVFDPRTFTALYEKTARLLANKPRGRLVPREGGDTMKATINNSILDFQWDDNERVDGLPMLAKWALMDMNARKYGASFGLAKWHYQTYADTKFKKRKVFYDGPNFKPLNNRDCLPNPSYSTIKFWFQHRDYVTINELMDVNDSAKSKPTYKNLDLLREAVQKRGEKGGDRRDTNYQMMNKTIKGLTDHLGSDEYNKVIEIVTEYQPHRWVTFAPNHGVVIRDIPNPYDHCEIPIVMLKYYPIDEDIYGMSEIEPIEKIQNATNALLCQYLDAINMSLYAPLKVRKTGGAVAMHTLEFGPGKKWLMDDPSTDVQTHDQNISGVTEFSTTYRFLISAMQEALGETSQGVSNVVPGQGDKTATEIRDSAIQRNVRDNFNQIFLSEAIKKQMLFWLKMNQQFLLGSDPQKVMRILGKDAIKTLQDMGLDKKVLSEEAIELMSQPEMEGLSARELQIAREELKTPKYPVETEDGEIVPKLAMEDEGQVASLYIDSKDLTGIYDYIPDVESMRMPDEAQRVAAARQAIELVLNPATAQSLMQEGWKIKIKDVLEDYMELLGKKDAEKYFEKYDQNKLNAGGGAGLQAGGAGGANGTVGGMEQGAGAMANGQAQPVVPGPVQVQ